MKKLFTLTCLLFSFFTHSSQLIDTLTKILELQTWSNDGIFVEIHDLQALNPGRKLLSIKKYLRNAGFIKSKWYPKKNVYYYRWINVNTRLPFFYINMDRSLLALFRSGSVVGDSKPLTDNDIFDAVEYNNYKKHVLNLLKNNHNLPSCNKENVNRPQFPTSLPERTPKNPQTYINSHVMSYNYYPKNLPIIATALLKQNNNLQTNNINPYNLPPIIATAEPEQNNNTNKLLPRFQDFYATTQPNHLSQFYYCPN